MVNKIESLKVYLLLGHLFCVISFHVDLNTEQENSFESPLLGSITRKSTFISGVWRSTRMAALERGPSVVGSLVV